MAVHLRMDFRILELYSSLHILQCQRGTKQCEHGVEYNPSQPGALVRAIQQLRRHTCAPMESEPPFKKPQVVDIRHADHARLRSGS